MAEVFAPFEVNGNYPLDKRQVFKTLKEMREFDTAHLPDTYFATCNETGKLYIYNKNNESLADTGKWRIQESGTTEFTYNNPNASTVTVGGITKGTSFDNVKLTDLLNDMFYPYTAFVFSTLSTNAAAGNFEYGTSKTIKTVTPTITAGSKAITKITIKNGSTILYESTSFTSGTAITLPTQISLDGTSDYTLTCELTDGTSTLNKSAKFSFAASTYYTVTDSNTVIPTSGTKYTGGANGVTIATQDNTYIWFLSPTEKSNIAQYALGQWNEVTTTSMGTVTFTLSSGKTYTMYAYVSPKMLTATGVFKLV